MPGCDIFISYSREDRPKARHFATCFAEEGFDVWWDAALNPGETFDEVIESELRAAKAVVVLWSPRSVGSRWVRAEATLADRRKKLVPVVIEACDLPIIFELTHTTDLSQWDGDTLDMAWQSFLRDLRRLVSRASAPTPPAAFDSTSKALPSPVPERSFAAWRGPAAADPSAGRKTSDRGVARGAAAAQSAADDLHVDDPSAEAEQTRFYTQSGGFNPLGDQFHCLEMKTGDQVEQRLVVSPVGLKIGRAAPADVILTDSRVSRSHCVVELADDRLRVSDLKSTNGTFIDGKRVEGTGMLEVGSVLKVGNVCFTHTVRTRADVKAA